jgi:hypothetical protein
MIKKIISIIVIGAFLCTSTDSYGSVSGRTLFGQRSHAQRHAVKENTGIASVYEDPAVLTVPQGMGMVVESFKGNNEGLVIHIQDCHTCDLAQFNIAGIIGSLAQNYGVDTVLLEAASGRLDSSFYDKYPNDQIKDDISKAFVKLSLFTGPEYYKVMQDSNMTMFGVEDKELYLRHLDSYLKGQPDQEKAIAWVNAIKTISDNLKLKLYSKELSSFSRKSDEYDNKLITLGEYSVYLANLSQCLF